jgi:hypothetical protein
MADAGEALRNTDDIPPIKEIDLGSVPGKLVRLRVVDYVLVFVAGSLFVSGLVGLISRGHMPSLIEMNLTLICGLCFFIGFRNFGIIEPSNWIDHAIVLPFTFALLSFYFFAYGALLASELSREVLASALYLIVLGAASLLGSLTALQLTIAKFGPAKTRLANWLNRLNAHGIALPTKLTMPVIDRRRGLLLAACGVLILGANLILQTLLPAVPPGVQNTLNLFVPIISFGILVRSRRYFQVSADTLLHADPRRPILLLRSFEEDERARFGMGDRQLLDFSIETRLGNHFLQFGPFIAVGSPLDDVPQIGAARAKLADDQWQGVVLGWMGASAIVVMLAGKTKWVTWELGRLVEGRHLQKLILLLPSKGSRLARRKDDSLARLQHLKDAFSDTQWASVLGTIGRPETVRVITFGPNGALTLIRSKSGSRDAYHLATLFAHDLMLPSAMPEASAERRRTLPWSRRLVVGGTATALALLAVVPLFVPGLTSTLCNKSDAFCALAGQPVPSKIARATQAADEFRALASKSDTPPRISEAAVKTLLARIFDTSTLDSGSARSEPTSNAEIARWFDAIQATYSVYLLFGTGVPDIGTAIHEAPNKPKLETKLADNVATYEQEVGLGLDSEMRVLGKLIEVTRASIDLDSQAERIRDGLAIVRRLMFANLIIDVWTIYVPPVDDDWRRGRLLALTAIAPAAAKFLVPDQRQVLRRLAASGAQSVHNEELRTKLAVLAGIFDSN